jgi:hypothetical protein
MILYFDRKDFIDNVKISISKTSNGIKLNEIMLEHITKH